MKGYPVVYVGSTERGIRVGVVYRTRPYGVTVGECRMDVPRGWTNETWAVILQLYLLDEPIVAPGVISENVSPVNGNERERGVTPT